MKVPQKRVASLWPPGFPGGPWRGYPCSWHPVPRPPAVPPGGTCRAGVQKQGIPSALTHLPSEKYIMQSAQSRVCLTYVTRHCPWWDPPLRSHCCGIFQNMRQLTDPFDHQWTFGHCLPGGCHKWCWPEWSYPRLFGEPAPTFVLHLPGGGAAGPRVSTGSAFRELPSTLPLGMIKTHILPCHLPGSIPLNDSHCVELEPRLHEVPGEGLGPGPCLAPARSAPPASPPSSRVLLSWDSGLAQLSTPAGRWRPGSPHATLLVPTTECLRVSFQGICHPH